MGQQVKEDGAAATYLCTRNRYGTHIGDVVKTSVDA